MIFLLKILYGLIGIGMGLAILKYRKIVYEWTGRWVWAERFLGSGWTVLVIILIGLGFIVAGVAYPLGAFDSTGPSRSFSPTGYER